MASGTVTSAYGASFAVASNSCADVKVGGDAFYAASATTYKLQSCASDPVVVGTALLFKNSAGTLASWSVQTISATAGTTSTPPTSSAAMDSGFIVAGLLLCVLFALGYPAGRASA